MKIDDANHDHAAAIFVISLALSHAHTAMQLISDVSLKQQLENKLHEVDELLRAASAKNAKL